MFSQGDLLVLISLGFVHYADVAKVEENRGHSSARNIAIGVGIGVGALLLAIAISIAHLD